jgi:ABC-type sugar transport system ATPase subunit
LDTPEPAGLEVRGLKKALPGFVLEADFSVPSGGRACLIGRSGSGKSTLLRAIAGLDSPGQGDSGVVRAGGRDLSALPAEKRGVGFIFQEQVLFPSMTVLENCVFALKLRGVPKEKREREGHAWLERLGLGALARSAVTTLSGGERQRVAFIRALIWKPTVLLLDEPFSALDSELRSRLREDLLALHESWPAPMVIVTHDQADALALATLRLKIEEIIPARRRVVIDS